MITFGFRLAWSRCTPNLIHFQHCASHFNTIFRPGMSFFRLMVGSGIVKEKVIDFETTDFIPPQNLAMDRHTTSTSKSTIAFYPTAPSFTTANCRAAFKRRSGIVVGSSFLIFWDNGADMHFLAHSQYTSVFKELNLTPESLLGLFLAPPVLRAQRLTLLNVGVGTNFMLKLDYTFNFAMCRT